MKHFGIFKVNFHTIRFKIYLWPQITHLFLGQGHRRGEICCTKSRGYFNSKLTVNHQSRKEMAAFPAATLSGPSDFLASPRPGQFNGFSWSSLSQHVEKHNNFHLLLSLNILSLAFPPCRKHRIII